jgi:hypothetical protein
MDATRKGEIDFFQQQQLTQGAANLGSRDRALQNTQTLSQLLGGTGQGFGGVAGGMEASSTACTRTAPGGSGPYSSTPRTAVTPSPRLAP